MFTNKDVAEVRHVVQRILVPCVFVIGLLGNSVSIYVLTRKRMRCTTNIYLTALAITDIIYLTMALLLSLKHYDYVQRDCELYWMFYGIVVWLCDACDYISIYIAVCFTIERFIAIRYPLKRQTFCTESLAKKVIAGVALFCLLSTISTAFEHQYHISMKLIDNNGEPCNQTFANAPKTLPLITEVDFNSIMWQGSGNGPIEKHNNMNNMEMAMQMEAKKFDAAALMTIKRDATIEVSTQRAAHVKAATTPLLSLSTPSSYIPNIAADNSDILLDAELFANGMEKYVQQRKYKDQLHLDDNGTSALMRSCHNVTFYKNIPSNLALNWLYMSFWNYFTTCVFVLIPLCVLVTFNCFLIMLVRKSKNLRGEMTNASSIRRPKRKSNISSVSQENRVTVTLIAVVLLFIICQLPWAIYLIVMEHMNIDVNLQAIIGNIFNFLAAINAAANFFLYCVLSDKYRKTVRELMTGYRYRRQRNTNTTTSLYATTATNGGSRRYRSSTPSVVIK